MDLRTQVAGMELDKLLVILVVLLSSVYCQDSDGWTGELEQVRGFIIIIIIIIVYLAIPSHVLFIFLLPLQDKWPNSAVIQDLLVRITRKPASPRKHLGLRRKDSSRSMNQYTFSRTTGVKCFQP